MLSKLKREAEVASNTSEGQNKKRRTDHNSDPTNGDDSTPLATTSTRKLLSFPLGAVRKIYLACPPNVQTGGPEAMHQLCHKINSLSLKSTNKTENDSVKSISTSNKVEAFMLYLRDRDGKAQHAPYEQPLEAYSSIYSGLQVAESMPESIQSLTYEHSATITDTSTLTEKKETSVEYVDELIIWPECWTHLMDNLHSTCITSKYPIHQTAIWWLSVDNNTNKFKQWKERCDILHLYQSEYARQYIMKNLGIKTSADTASTHKNVLVMTEFIPPRSSTATNASDTPSQYASPPLPEESKRDLDILYNPVKGIHYTDEIKKRSENYFKFTPIGGGPHGQTRLSPEEVVKLLRRAKVYIDFGPHPGMDRLPREAALANCIVLTNMSGAAYYEQDVPIPQRFKFRKFDVHKIHGILKDCMEKYEETTCEFDGYRKWIKGQEGQMDKCVLKFMKSVNNDRG